MHLEGLIEAISVTAEFTATILKLLEGLSSFFWKKPGRTDWEKT